MGLSDLYGIGFAIGLITLTKSPTANMSFILLISFASVCFFNSSNCNLKKRHYGLAMVLSTVPFWVWKLFTMHVGIAENRVSGGLKFFNGELNIILMEKLFVYIAANYMDAIALTAISFLFIILTFRKKEYVCIAPSIVLIILVLLYYGYIYQDRDFKSAERYLIPQALALFYFGGVGLQRLMDTLDQRKWPQLLKISSFFVLSVIAMFVMF